MSAALRATQDITRDIQTAKDASNRTSGNLIWPPTRLETGL